jgi:hypothetical protein
MQRAQAILQEASSFLPSWVISVAVLWVAIACALFVHKITLKLATRAIGPRQLIPLQILQATAGPTRLALGLAAVALVMPLAPLNDELRNALAHLFVVASIAFVGWILIRAVDMTAARYLQRYRSDIEQNFVARKHVTQVRVFKRRGERLQICCRQVSSAP